jgi:hypothetical protein
MKLLVRVGWMGALLVALATYPLVALLASQATDAYIIAAKSPQMVQANHALFDARDPKESDQAYHKRVMEIYGNPVDYTTPVLFVSKEKLLHPKEAPALTLLPVNKEEGENPLQVKSLYFFAKYVVTGSSVTFAILLLVHVFLARRAPKAPPATPSPSA